MNAVAKTAALACMCMLAGCYSMDVATNNSLKKSALTPDDGRPVEHVVVCNNGWYLFYFIPIVCGNATPGAVFPWKFFTNQVKPELLHDRMMTHAASQNADVKELTFFHNEQVLFSIPDFPVPIPYLLCYREIQFSGLLAHRPKDEPAKAKDPSATVEEMNRLLNRLNAEDVK